MLLSLTALAAPSVAQVDYWTGKGDHFFLGACCYCVEAERHEVRDGVHQFLVDGQWKAVDSRQVRLTPDPRGQKIYYCSGSLHLRDEVPKDRCGLVRGSG
jgi:hypothetical protein